MNVFMGLAGVVLAGYVVYMLLQRFPGIKAVIQSQRTPETWGGRDFWKGIWNDPRMRRRIYITLGLIVVYKLLIFIPLPGVDISGVRALYERLTMIMPDTYPKPVANPLFDRFYRELSLFNIGLVPYLFACIVFQFLAVIVRPWRRAMFSRNGHITAARATIMIALVWALAQSFFKAIWLEKAGLPEFMLVPDPGWMFRISVMLSMTAGFCLVLWLANLITEKGIGNGIAFFVCADILVRVFYTISRFSSDIFRGVFPPIYYGVGILLLVSMALIAFRVTLWEKHVELRIGGHVHPIAMRLSRMGNMPVSIALFFLSLPAMAAASFPDSTWQTWAAALSRGTFFYYPALALLIFSGAYLYMAIIINPELRARRFARHQFSCGGKAEEQQIEDYLYTAYNSLALGIAVILFLFAIMPDILMVSLKIYYLFAGLFGVGTFFILAGLLRDTTERLAAQVKMEKESYCCVCYTSIDEIDAVLRKGLLEAQGIPCVLEPLRFTWGLPVLTAGDRFCLYVSPEHCDKATQLIQDEDA